MLQLTKYQKWHDSIIERANKRILPYDIYLEKHHIIPRSLGGSNESSNLVKLTAKEHFIVHLLLTKILPCAPIYSAIFYMRNLRGKITSKLYENLKIKFSEHRSKEYSGINNPRYGSKCSEETKKRISESLKSRKLSEETKLKMREAHLRRKLSGIPGNQLGKKLPRKVGYISPLKGTPQNPKSVKIRMSKLTRNKDGRFASINPRKMLAAPPYLQVLFEAS